MEYISSTNNNIDAPFEAEITCYVRNDINLNAKSISALFIADANEFLNCNNVATWLLVKKTTRMYIRYMEYRF